MSLVIALSAFKATFGLVIVFFVIFPLLLHGLVGFALAQSAGEYQDNLEYLEGGEDTKTLVAALDRWPVAVVARRRRSTRTRPPSRQAR